MIWLKIIAWIIIGLGIVGTVAPLLPGAPLVWVGALILAWVDNFQRVGWQTLGILGLLALFSFLLDWLAAYLGAKAGGASWKGLLGGLVGMAIGALLGNLIGAIIGATLGIFLVEIVHGQPKQRAARSSLGYVVGYLIGTVFQVAITVLMFAILLIKLWL